MIGASVAGAMRAAGWHVSGTDASSARAETAKQLNLIDDIGVDESARLSFVATPVEAVPEVAAELLALGGFVTDVASVKEPVLASISHPNFVGGHPMAGSEKTGPESASADLFQGVTWVLTPTESTGEAALSNVKDAVEELGARTLTVGAVDHDRAVARVSHVPHLVASALMSMAVGNPEEDPTRLRLAAGGFRDMTRIAAGSSSMWTRIAIANRVAVVSELDQLIAELSEMRELVAVSDHDRLLAELEAAAVARRELPERAGRPRDLAVLHVVVPDEPGSLGAILGVLGRLEVNVEDFEITHDQSNRRGYLEVTVATADAARSRQELITAGFSVGSEEL